MGRSTERDRDAPGDGERRSRIMALQWIWRITASSDWYRRIRAPVGIPS